MSPQEMIDVIQAYKDGKQIEFKSREPNSKNWETTNCPSWSFTTTMYRIKQKEEKELYQYLIHNPQINTYKTTIKFYENSFDLQLELTFDWKIIQRLNHTKVIIKEE